MLNRNSDHQINFFGREVKRSYLNWGNFAFFFLVAICADNSLEKHHHKPGDDLDTFDKKFFMLLVYVSLLSFILINKKQIKRYFTRVFSPTRPSEASRESPRVFIVAPIVEEAKYSSQTLDICIARGQRIKEKLVKIHASNCELLDVCPKKFECPISIQTMYCPVVASDGDTYDYDSIYPIIMTTKRSPRTREPLSNALNPQYKLQDQIETWANKQISKINAWEKETKDRNADNGNDSVKGRPKIP